MKFSTFLLIAWFSVFSQSGSISSLEAKIFPVFNYNDNIKRINNLKASVNVKFIRNCRVIRAYKLSKIDSNISVKNEISISVKTIKEPASYEISLSGIQLIDNLEDIYIETRCHSLWNTTTKI